MKFKKKAVRFSLAIILAATSISESSCTPAWISSEKKISIERSLEDSADSTLSGYIAGFEGMQPFSGYRIKNLVEELCSNNNVAGCATSSNVSSHLHFIEKAHKQNIPIYIIGYSSGANDARKLAYKCKKRDIPVETLFLLDPSYLDRPFPGKIPGNVKKVINYRSAEPRFVKGKPLTKKNLENPQTFFENYNIPSIGHMDLPGYIAEKIKIDILRD